MSQLFEHKIHHGLDDEKAAAMLELFLKHGASGDVRVSVPEEEESSRSLHVLEVIVRITLRETDKLFEAFIKHVR